MTYALERFVGQRLLVIGDAMLDRTIWGAADRVSPEAPVPVVRVERETESLGGAANVAANLVALGAQTRLVALCGRDAPAERLRQQLGELQIGGALIPDASVPTTVKTRIIARGRQLLRYDREAEQLTAPSTRDEFEERARELLAETDALIVSDYAKGAIQPEGLRRVLQRARQLDIPVAIDPKPAHFDAYQPSSVIKPNAAEAQAATAIPVGTDAGAVEAARAILARLDTTAVLLTRGEQGMMLLERGRDPQFIAAAAREVYDVTGAGDTAIAVLGLALAAGLGLGPGAELSNRAAGWVVRKVGTATVRRSELVAGPQPSRRRGPTSSAPLTPQ